MRSFLFAAVLVCTAVGSAATVRPALSGKVVDADGKAVAHATVMVYHAGVKTGYSIYCRSCYADCGKRVLTDANGEFEIKDLAPDLWFELLAARDGFVPAFSTKVDPATSGEVSVSLATQPARKDFSGVVRGRIVDEGGTPVRDAVVSPTGLMMQLPGYPGEHAGYGTFDGLQPIAVTNEKGEFEVSYAKPTSAMLLDVEARGMAEKFVVMASGEEHHTVALSEGGTIAGRLVANGKPVANAQVGLIPKGKGGYQDNLKIIGNPYEEIRIGTDANGRFTVSNVPAPVDWYVYAKMDSIAGQGATNPVEAKVERDGQYVTALDLVMKPGFRLSGTVLVTDGRPIRDGMHVSTSLESVSDSQTVPIGSDGRFEFKNLPAGDYEIWASMKGYHEQEPKGPAPTMSVTHDVSGLNLTVYPN